jgi:hypothetical protein
LKLVASFSALGPGERGSDPLDHRSAPVGSKNRHLASSGLTGNMWILAGKPQLSKSMKKWAIGGIFLWKIGDQFTILPQQTNLTSQPAIRENK